MYAGTAAAVGTNCAEPTSNYTCAGAPQVQNTARRAQRLTVCWRHNLRKLHSHAVVPSG